MRNWISENRMLFIGGLLLLGFVGFVFAQSKPADGNTQSAASFKQIDPTSNMRRGSADAKVSFIQYSDFLCPSCSYISTQIMPEIDKNYIETGKVQFEFRPMAFIAEGSVQAGMGAYCALDQDKFWPYHDRVYEFVAAKVFRDGLDPKTDVILTASLVKNLAGKAGLAQQQFDDCLDSKTHLSDITKSTNTANRNGVTATPYLLIDGRQVTGNPSPQTIETMIKAVE